MAFVREEIKGLLTYLQCYTCTKFHSNFIITFVEMTPINHKVRPLSNNFTSATAIRSVISVKTRSSEVADP